MQRLKRVAQMTPRQISARAVGKLFGFAAEHHFTDRLLNLPSPLWRFPHAWSGRTPAEGTELIERLCRDGLVMLPGFLDSAQLDRARAAVESQFNPELGKGMEFRNRGKFYACTQPLAICPEFVSAAFSPDLLNLVGGYFRRVPFLSESDFRRVLPLDMAQHELDNEKFAKGHSSSHWHYDLRGRQIKVMIYLTDVGPDDQNFAYCLKSHTGFKSVKYENSRFTDDKLAQMGLEPLECLGSAGTAIIFDTNGIHRLRRRPSRVRDSVTFNYHPGRMYRAIPQIIHPDVSPEQREKLNRVTVLAN